jgi:hypothetical protein
MRIQLLDKYNIILEADMIAFDGTSARNSRSARARIQTPPPVKAMRVEDSRPGMRSGREL